MASRVATKRLTLEYKSLRESPTPYIEARPSEQDILQWFYLITGPPDTAFAGGQYMGELRFPADYPYGPPSIRMLTPSGRFEPGSRICLNMSDFHVETWNPAWNVSTILTGLLSFMCSDEMATGAMYTSPEKKVQYTKKSVKWNLENRTFLRLFPEVVDEIKQSVPNWDTIDTIEVIPPSPSDLVKKIYSSYRASAYETAEQSAKAIHQEQREKLRAEAEQSKQSPKAAAPSGLPTTAMIVVAGVLILAIAYMYVL